MEKHEIMYWSLKWQIAWSIDGDKEKVLLQEKIFLSPQRLALISSLRNLLLLLIPEKS